MKMSKCALKLISVCSILCLFQSTSLAADIAVAQTQKNKNQINLNPELKMNVNDLGFEDSVLKVNSEESELLQVRAHKLQRHQFWGLTTWGLMTATVLAAPEGGPASDVHRGLAALTALSYVTTAYLSLSAPEPVDMQNKGNSLKVHKMMMWIHLPGMILLPLAGIEAQRQAQDINRPRNSEGEMNFDGLASHKKQIASLTYAAFTVAMLSMTFDF